MTTPSFAQLRNTSSTALGLLSETVEERILTLLAILASSQNPDGTAFTLPAIGSGRTHTPNFVQYKSPYNSVSSPAGLVWHGESLRERLLTCLAVYVSGQNPDGSQIGS
jgi:hypothetical protein